MPGVRYLMLAVLAMSQSVWLPGAYAQLVQLGGEFQVNSFTTDRQEFPAVAADGSGNFVVVWQSASGNPTDPNACIQGQRYNAAGTPVGSQFQVNTYTTGLQGIPRVAADAAGNFVVVWKSHGGGVGPTSYSNVQGQRYNAAGTPLGSEFQVNSYTSDYQGDPAVAAADAGSFVVVWVSNGSAGTDTSPTSQSIQGQRYDAAGTPVGGQFQVNSTTTNNQRAPAVATDAAGNFVVVWESMVGGSAGTDPSGSVQGQRYDSAGQLLGGEFQVNSYTTGFQYDPAVAIDGAGNFVVVWHSENAHTDPSASVHGQRYDGAGVPLGGEFQVNSYTTGDQSDPVVAADNAGNFVVVWTSDGGAGTDADSLSVQGQLFDASGTPVGGEFQVNSYTTNNQWFADVATDGVGRFVVGWTSNGSAASDTSLHSVHGQRYAVSTTSTTSTTLPPTDLLPGRITVIKPGALAKFVAKPVTGDTFALPAANPVAEGGSLRIFDTASTAGDNSYTLPLGVSWKGLGNPAGSKGYKYKGAGTPGDPCKVVLVKEKVIKAVCKGTGITLAPPFDGDVGIVLSLGMTDRYCAQFGGDEVKNDATVTKRKKAPAPGVCP